MSNTVNDCECGGKAYFTNILSFVGPNSCIVRCFECGSNISSSKPYNGHIIDAWNASNPVVAPCPLDHTPNTETEAVLRDSEAGVNIVHHESLDELFDDLGIKGDAEPSFESDLRQVSRIAAGAMIPEFIPVWLETPLDVLGGKSPRECLKDGERERVFRIAFYLGSGMQI